MAEIKGMVTPVGRMVQGDPFEEVTTNMKGQPLTDSKGGPRVEYFFAIGVPKNSPEWGAFHAQLKDIAAAGWPGGESNLPNFSWKIVDGDAPENAQKEGFPGHWVLRATNGFPIAVYSKGGEERIVAPSGLKRGDFIRAYVTARSNNTPDKPGIYINPSMIEVVGFGTEIHGGPDATAVFGAAAAALPAGASATPTAGTPLAPPVTAPPVTAPPVTAPPVTAPPVTAPPVTVKTMTVKAAGATYQAMIDLGWTDATLVEHGYMINTAPGVVPDTSILT